MLSRRAVLLGGAAATGLGVAGSLGVHQGVLPGRPQAQSLLGLNGEAGVVPDIAPGPVRTGSFVSERRLGVEVGWSLLRPPDSPGPLPLVVALHGRRADHARLTGPAYGLPQFLAAAVAKGVPPFAIATVDGGDSYWHRRPSGEDAAAMVVDELVPLMAEEGVTTARLGLIGWSMGGYGALHLAGLLGAERVAAVVATSPAIWSDADDARPSGFEDAAEYDALTVAGRQDDLDGVRVRVDCGTGDSFYRATQDYVEGFGPDTDVVSTFEPGGHDGDYWRRMLPDQLEFLGVEVG